MDLAELRTEFQARGFDYITPDSRVDRFLNDAYHQLCDRYAWPFLETTITGVAPLLITDLRAVLSVTDITTEARLWGADLRDILASDPSLSATGEPDFWYLDGQVTVGVYPANTSDTLSVRYLSSPVDL